MKISTYISLAIISILGVLCFGLFKENSELKNFNIELSKSATVIFSDKPVQLVPQYKAIQIPKKIVQYKSDPIVLTRVELVPNTDTVRIYLKDSTKMDLSSRFLTQFPKSPKLVQLTLGSKNLNLTLLNTQGEVQTENYDVDTRFHDYNFVNGTLTSKRKNFLSRFNPFVETTLRPFNNLWDLDLGLKYNTRKFIYEMGFNCFYYPDLKSNPGLDLSLKLRYEF